MSTMLEEPKSALNESHQAWLKQMGVIFNIKMSSKQPVIEPVAGRHSGPESKRETQKGHADRVKKSAPLNGNNVTATAGVEPPVTNRGLQTLYLTSFSRQSTRNLGKVLAAEGTNQVVTLAICPFFDL